MEHRFGALLLRPGSSMSFRNSASRLRFELNERDFAVSEIRKELLKIFALGYLIGRVS